MNQFSGIWRAFKALGIAFLISLPLAMWKLGEIVAWVIRNIEITMK